MRILSFLTVWLTSMAVFCSQAVAQGYQPNVDTSNIASYADYKHYEEQAYKLYQERSNGFYKKGQLEIGRHYTEYSERRQVALEELRSTDRTNYLEWLDARAIGDHPRETRLETTVPALILFKQKDTGAFEIFSAKKKSITEDWSKKNTDMFIVYQEEKRLLWSAYQALPKK